MFLHREIHISVRRDSETQVSSNLYYNQNRGCFLAPLFRDRAEEDAKGTRKAMLEEMKDEVADLAVSIAGRVLAGSEKGADEAALREKALQELSSSEVKTGD